MTKDQRSRRGAGTTTPVTKPKPRPQEPYRPTTRSNPCTTLKWKTHHQSRPRPDSRSRKKLPGNRQAQAIIARILRYGGHVRRRALKRQQARLELRLKINETRRKVSKLQSRVEGDEDEGDRRGGKRPRANMLQASVHDQSLSESSNRQTSRHEVETVDPPLLANLPFDHGSQTTSRSRRLLRGSD